MRIIAPALEPFATKTKAAKKPSTTKSKSTKTTKAATTAKSTKSTSSSTKAQDVEIVADDVEDTFDKEDERLLLERIGFANMQFKQSSYLTINECKASPAKTKTHISSLSEYLFNHRHFNEYLSSLNKQDLLSKLGLSRKRTDMTIHDLIEMYKLQLRPVLAEADLAVLQKYCTLVDAIFVHHDLKHLTEFPWKIMSSLGSLEWNMPFTVADVIIIPQSIINQVREFHEHYDNEKWTSASKNTMKQFINRARNARASKEIDTGSYVGSFIDIMIHERIHIIQRANQDKFNIWYASMFPFMSPFETQDDQRAAILADMTGYTENPDSNFLIWTIRYIPETNPGQEMTITPFMAALSGKPKASYLPWPPVSTAIARSLDDAGIPWHQLLALPRSKMGGNHYHPNEIIATWIASEFVDTETSPSPALLTFLKKL